jgi:peptide/nickel transport system ATP-binding protein
MTNSDATSQAAEESVAPARVAVERLTVLSSGTGSKVIQDISLEVRGGEILGIVGESGSGKTTLGLAMIQHTRRGLKIGEGTVVVDGQNLGALSGEQLRELRGNALAYVPQDPGTALNPARRIGPQLTEALTAHGRSKEEAEARIQELLNEVGLSSVPHVLTSYPHQLSGGQQQRVTIAVAFACRPALIVMDEPTTGLDVSTQRTVLETVKNLCVKSHVAAIYVSHDLLVVGELANRVAVVYSGRVVELGTTEEVFRSPQHPYTRGLLRAIPSPDRASRLVGIEGVQPRPGQRPPGCAFLTRCPVKMDNCATEPPELYPAGPDGHVARCLRVGEADTLPSAPAVTTELSVQDRPPIPPSAPETVLGVTNLNANYGPKQVLHDISLVIPPNACVAIVGESGSGKTTLARCFAGLHTAWTGDMVLQGEKLTPGIRHRSKDALQRVQYIFQNPYASLNPRRTIGGLLSQPLEHFTKLSRRERNERIVQAIRSVSLPTQMLDRYPDQLSGGERQRIAIARALIVEPRVVVCDEVTSALDVSVQAAVVEMLRRLQAEQNLSMLFVTHNLALVRSIAQQVAVIRLGRLVEAGPTETVLTNPQTEYTQRLLEDIPKFSNVGTGATGI